MTRVQYSTSFMRARPSTTPPATWAPCWHKFSRVDRGVDEVHAPPSARSRRTARAAPPMPAAASARRTAGASTPRPRWPSPCARIVGGRRPERRRVRPRRSGSCGARASTVSWSRKNKQKPRLEARPGRGCTPARRRPSTATKSPLTPKGVKNACRLRVRRNGTGSDKLRGALRVERGVEVQHEDASRCFSRRRFLRRAPADAQQRADEARQRHLLAHLPLERPEVRPGGQRLVHELREDVLRHVLLDLGETRRAAGSKPPPRRAPSRSPRRPAPS